MLLIDGEKRFKDRVANILKPGNVTLKPGKSTDVIDPNLVERISCIPLHWRYEPVLPELCQVQGKTGKDRIGADRYRIIDCFWSLPGTIDVNPFFRWIDEPAKL